MPFDFEDPTPQKKKSWEMDDTGPGGFDDPWSDFPTDTPPAGGGGTGPQFDSGGSMDSLPAAKRPKVRTPRRRSAGMPSVSIPWNIVIPILGVIIAVTLCVVFRDEITDFFEQVMEWVIVIVVVYVVWRVIFGRRRR